jgi:magnesium transporter
VAVGASSPQHAYAGIARQLVVADVPRATAASRAGDVRAALVGRSFASATEVAVLDEDRLVGLVPLEVLLAADADAVMGELAVDAPTVALDSDIEVAARRAARSGSRSVAVADAEGSFQGLVPADRLLRVLELEHEEDLARLGGFLSQSSVARIAAEEAVPRRLWHRLPWLGIGLAGAMASVVVVGSFEEQIRDEVLLALFIPAVVYMADAVGTQTETVVIRGMAVGVPIRAVAGRELGAGLVIGLLVGCAFFPFALAVWGDVYVATTVSLALVVSCSVATVVALTLPYAITRFGGDPAFGAGPLATVIQDLLSILAYFSIAVLLS